MRETREARAAFCVTFVEPIVPWVPPRPESVAADPELAEVAVDSGPVSETAVRVVPEYRSGDSSRHSSQLGRRWNAGSAGSES